MEGLSVFLYQSADVPESVPWGLSFITFWNKEQISFYMERFGDFFQGLVADPGFSTFNIGNIGGGDISFFCQLVLGHIAQSFHNCII